MTSAAPAFMQRSAFDLGLGVAVQLAPGNRRPCASERSEHALFCCRPRVSWRRLSGPPRRSGPADERAVGVGGVARRGPDVKAARTHGIAAVLIKLGIAAY